MFARQSIICADSFVIRHRLDMVSYVGDSGNFRHFFFLASTTRWSPLHSIIHDAREALRVLNTYPSNFFLRYSNRILLKVVSQMIECIPCEIFEHVQQGLVVYHVSRIFLGDTLVASL